MLATSNSEAAGRHLPIASNEAVECLLSHFPNRGRGVKSYGDRRSLGAPPPSAQKYKGF